MKKEVINHLTWLTNMLSQPNTFINWSGEIKVRESKDAFEKFYNSLKKQLDITKLTVEEAKELRFSPWSEEFPNLYLFPLWIVPLIPEGTTVYGLDGKPYVYEKNKVDNDIRYGCVAYGLMIEDKTDKEEVETITISQSEYSELFRCSAKLSALESAGVDNWEDYDIAMDMMEDEE